MTNPEWAARVCAANPFRQDPASGVWISAPGRLIYPNVYDLHDNNGRPEYGCGLVLPPMANVGAYVAALGAAVRSQPKLGAAYWPEGQGPNPALGKWGFSPLAESPDVAAALPDWFAGGFRLQAKIGGKDGAAPSRRAIVTDARGAPLEDRARVYAGAWAVLVVVPYVTFAKQKGFHNDLQQVIVLADDEALALSSGGARVNQAVAQTLAAGIAFEPPAGAVAPPAGYAPAGNPFAPQPAPQANPYAPQPAPQANPYAPQPAIVQPGSGMDTIKL